MLRRATNFVLAQQLGHAPLRIPGELLLEMLALCRRRMLRLLRQRFPQLSSRRRMSPSDSVSPHRPLPCRRSPASASSAWQRNLAGRRPALSRTLGRYRHRAHVPVEPTATLDQGALTP